MSWSGGSGGGSGSLTVSGDDIDASLEQIQDATSTTTDLAISTTNAGMLSDSSQFVFGASEDVGLVRNAASILEVTDGSTGDGALKASAVYVGDNLNIIEHDAGASYWLAVDDGGGDAAGDGNITATKIGINKTFLFKQLSSNVVLRNFADSAYAPMKLQSVDATSWIRTADRFQFANNARIYSGTGSPESAQAADPGSLYTDHNGGANVTLYVKESGTGNTGWIAK